MARKVIAALLVVCLLAYTALEVSAETGPGDALAGAGSGSRELLGRYDNKESKHKEYGGKEYRNKGKEYEGGYGGRYKKKYENKWKGGYEKKWKGGYEKKWKGGYEKKGRSYGKNKP